MTPRYNSLSLLLLLAALLPFTAWGQGTDADLFGNESLNDKGQSLKEELSLKGRPIYFDNMDYRDDLDGKVFTYSEDPSLDRNGKLEYHYMKNRRALVGDDCAINKIINAVGVGNWSTGYGNMLDDDLDNYCEINSVLSVGLTVNPSISVRDRSAYYAKGTEAGFCLVPSSGNTVLSLDVIKAMVIGFYRDGKLVGTTSADQGQEGSGVNLGLINIPTSSDANLYVSAIAPAVFDEITLDYAGGLSLNAGQNIKIKYAYVGKAKQFTITTNKDNGSIGPNSPYNEFGIGNEDVTLDYVKGWDPVLLGLPFPFTQRDLELLTDYNLKNGITITPILSVGYQGGAKFMMKHSNSLNKEVYEAGMEVGFQHTYAGVLSLDAGAWLKIILFDRNGNKVQEEDITAEVLSLNVAQGGASSSSIMAKVPFSGAEIRFHTVLGVNLGGFQIHYAYVQPAPEIRHHCPINPSADPNLCAGQTSFQLRSNPDVSVTWSLLSAPKGSSVSVTPGGFVTSVDKDGEYVFKAMSDDGCVDYVTLSSGQAQALACSKPLVNKKDKDSVYVITDDNHTSSGSLLSASGFKEGFPRENILTEDFTKYATYVGGISLANNLAIIGVKRLDGCIYDAEEEIKNQGIESKGKKLGFVVSSAVEGINLSLLQFMQIRCYYQGVEVFSSVIDDSNAISADVGGANGGQKLRYCITVPSSNDKQPDYTKVDEIILWKSGVLDLGLGELNIYYAYTEDIDSECDDYLGFGCGSQILSAKETHTTIDYDMMSESSGSAINVANAVNDIDNLIDDDISSFMSLANTVSVGNGLSIGVKLGRTLDYRHQLGIIMNRKTFVGEVGVGDWLTIETFYNGVSNGDTSTDWNVVDANVAGYGDMDVLYVQPTAVYDEVKLTFAAVIDALKVMKLYGLSIRSDIDNDGIPDCQDPDSCPDVEIAVGEIGDVCAGETVVANASGGIKDNTYIFRFSEPGIAPIDKIVTSDDTSFSAEYITKTPGMYQLIITDGSGTPLVSQNYTVHPTETTWKKSATNTDWNKWDNWTNGSPYCCTNVIIPSDAKRYPDLNTLKVEKGDEFCCDGIHFEPRAEVNSITNLNYAKAWVEAELSPNRYYLLASPLKGVVTGDMFITANASLPKVFTDLTEANNSQNRFSPRMYQRMWDRSVEDRLWGEGYQTLPNLEKIDKVKVAKWSSNFNHLAYEYGDDYGYGNGNGFALWVDNEELPESTKFRFRLPKNHTTYNYYSDFDKTLTGHSETITRGENYLGNRFIYEAADATEATEAADASVAANNSPKNNITFPYKGNERTVYTATLPYEVTLTAGEDKTSEHFLFGNPFMSSIDIRTFLVENERSVLSLMTYDGSTYTTASLTTEANSEARIAPMQSVVLTANGEAITALTVRVTAEMLTQAKAIPSANVHGNRGEGTALIVEASNGKLSSSVTLVENLEEGHMSLLDNEVMPRLAILVLGNGTALDIAPLSDRVPLAIMCAGRERVAISFRACNGFNRDDYRIEDLATGMTYSLDEEIEFPEGFSGSLGRLMLVSNRESGVEAIENDADGIYVEMIGETAHIRSAVSPIASVAAYSLSGWLTASRSNVNSPALNISLPRGPQVLVVTTASGSTRSFKILV